jgi:hypothetical protein
MKQASGRILIYIEARSGISRELGAVYPHLVRTCGRCVLMDWPGNKWTKGSYSFSETG